MVYWNMYFVFPILCFKGGRSEVLIASVAGQDIWNNNTPVFAFPCHPFHMFLLKQDTAQPGKMSVWGEERQKRPKGETDAEHKDKQGRGLGEEEVLNWGKWKEGGLY